MTLGGGLVAGLTWMAGDEDVVRHIIKDGYLLGLSTLAMAIAGISGGVIGSTLTQIKTFDEFWTEKQGPWDMKILSGKGWVWLEHTFFWISLGLATAGILCGEVAKVSKNVPEIHHAKSTQCP